jgi:PadR family transcriptional regulator
MGSEKDALEMMKGTLDVLILKTLSRGPAHGYAISRWIRTVTEEALSVEEGALYPALHRLEERGWITSEWGLSENNRKARFYRLTVKGTKRLASETSTWKRFAHAVGRVLDSSEEAP